MKRTAPTLRGRALAWLAQREHSRAELQLKLRRWAVQPESVSKSESEHDEGRPAASDEEIERLLDELQAAQHLCDGRFIESRVHARESRYGNRRIEQELRQHGVKADADVNAHLRATELQRARAVHGRKFTAAATTAAERMRQMRFLAARGFTADTINRVLRGLDDES
jgi:regulatory protein